MAVNRQTYTDDGKKTDTKKTVSKPDVVRDTTSSTNLAGVDYQKISAGTPKTSNTGSNPTGVNTQSYNLAGANNVRNAGGSVRNTTKVNNDVYVPNYSKPATTAPNASNNLQKYQSTLSGLADSSTKKANEVVNKISNAWNSFVQTGQNNQDYQNQLRQSRFEKSRQNVYAQKDAERADLNKQTTAEDYSRFFNQDGSNVDFNGQIKDLNGRKATLENIISTAQNDTQKASAQAELDDVTKQIEELDLLNRKREALEEGYTLNELKNSGNEDAYKMYREEISHKDDNLAQRAGNALSHLLVETANEVPTMVDQFAYRAKANAVNQNIELINQAYENKELTTDEYVKAMADLDDRIKQAKEEYNDSTSQQIRRVVDSYGVRTFYGASDVEKLVLQTGESMAQFALHFAIGQGIASIVFKDKAILDAGMQFAVEQFGEETASGLARDYLMELGVNALGGDIATITMSGAGMTSRINQLLDEGYPIETAYTNGLFYGLTSYLTEKIGMDAFVEAWGTRASVDIVGKILKDRTVAGFLAEGGEEFIEELVDPFIDSVTLGKDYEVNGNELLIAFMLGGVSGGIMSGGAVAVNTAKTAISVNRFLNQNRVNRGNITSLNNVGKLLINNRQQYNMARSEMEILERNYSTMTDVQKQVYEEIKQIYESAKAEYEAKSQTLGVDLAGDQVVTPTVEENEHTLAGALVPDVNQEVEMMETLDQLQEETNKGVDKVIEAENNINLRTQEMLAESGYDIDAEYFNSLDQNRQNEALVALDFAKAKGTNIRIVGDEDLKEFLLQNDPNIQNYSYNHAPAETNAKIQSIIDGTSGIRFGDAILINGNKNPILSTLVHELTHGTESSELYNPLKEAVKRTTQDWNSIVEDKATIYDDVQDFTKPDGTIDEKARFENAEHEVVANIVEENLGNEQFLDDLIRYDYSLFSRIYQNIQALGNTDETIRIKNAFEKAFLDYSETDAQTNPAYSLNKTWWKIVKSLAPGSINKETGNFKSIAKQIADLRANAVKHGFGVVPLGNGALEFAGVRDLLLFDLHDLGHMNSEKHPISDSTIANLLQRLNDKVVLGLDYEDKNGAINKDIVLEDDDGKRYLLSINKNNKNNLYYINEIINLFEPVDDGVHNLNNFVLQNITRNNYYYANEKSSDFLKRLGISSQDAVRKAIALDLRVPGERRGVKFSYSFHPKANGENVDNFDSPISKGMAKFLNGTKLTDGRGRPLRLFHTSNALFSNFDPRGTGHYRFGDKTVNYFSTSEAVSGSYTEGVYSQVTSEETYANEENKGKQLAELEKQLEQVREEADLKGDEMRTQLRHVLWDYDLNEISNRLKEATEISAENWLDEAKGFENYSLPFNVDRAIRSLGNEYNGAEYTAKRLIEIYDYVNGNDVTPEVKSLFNAINEVDVPELIRVRGQLESEIERLEDETLRLSNEINKLEERGVQYVGYGLAKNPYVIENEHGNDRNNTVNWNSINNADWTISENDVGDLHNEIKNVFAKFKADGITADDMVGLDLVVQTKNKTNRFILENVNDETREFLIKNPIALANMTNAVQKSVDGAWTYQNFADNLDTNLDNYWGRADENGKYNYKYGGKLETNDVVKAVLAINDFTDNKFDGVVFKDITDSGSFYAQDVYSDIVALFDSNQFKLIENENPSYNADIRYSYGYHYGAENLDYNKKSERLSSRSGRGTGAFGTGTYFFGEEGAERAKGYHFTDGRTEHKVDFSDYNLYKPKNAEQGFRLHQLFKELDDNYSTQIKSKAEIKQRVSEIISELNEIEPNLNDDGSYEDLLLSPEQEEDIRNRLIELGDSEQFVDELFDENRNERGGSVLADYLADELNQRYIEEDTWSRRKHPRSLDYAEDYENMKSHIPELAEILGVDEGRMFDVANEAIQSAENDTHKRDFWNGNYDSVGTRVMKALGYEGIDVRGIKELDNSSYGSVIYDLKPETVRYSYDAPDDGIINKEYNDELKRIQEPSSSLSEEQVRLLESRDPAFLKGIRERITALFRSRDDTGSDSNNDSKRIITVSGDDFYEFFKANKNYLKNSETVTLHNKEDYQNGTAYMSNDGLSGFYIADDGDVQSVFNNSGKPGFLLDIADIVRENGYSLDCFESDVNHLAEMYKGAFGFKVASILDFNREVMEEDHGKEFTDTFVEKFGEAPVYFMVKTDADVETKHFNKDQWQEAYDYRNSFINMESQTDGDLNMTDEELEKYGGVKTVETQKYGKKNIDKETGIYRPKAIVELDSTIGKTTHEEEMRDGEDYAGRFAQELDNGVDVDELLQRLMENPLQNGLVRAYYVSQVLADRDMQSEYMELAQWARDIDNLGGKLIESTKILYDLDSTFSRAVYLSKVEENLKDEYKQRLKGSKGANVEQIINELFNKYANDIINSTTNREFRSAIGALSREVNRRMPKTIWDRITQYRMLAMLSGSKTAISNAVSNLASVGLYRMNGINQALLESALQDVTIRTVDDTKTYKIKQEDRRATLKKDSKVSKRNRQIASEVWKTLDIGNRTKYGIETEKIPDIIKKNLKTENDTVRSKASKFVDMMFETAQSAQSVILSDAPFARMAFVQKFDELARARNINLETIDKKSKVYNRLIDDAFAYAEEVVSHNETDISKTIANITRASSSNVRINEDSTLVGFDKMIKRFKEKANNGEPIYKFIDGTVTKLQKWFIPFYKTNASIFQKSLQYSPLEWAQVANDWGKVKAGRMELVDMVDHMAKAVTGSELYLLGAIFGYLGWLKWEKDDEDYSGKLSIKIPGTDNGYTVDFIDPVSTIFAKGVVLAQEGSENGVSFKTFENLIHEYEDIFLSDELDMFSSMKDFFDTVGKVNKGEDEYGEYTLGDGATDIAFNVLNSYVPAIVRDVSRMIDPAKKVVYDTDNKKYLFNRLVNSTPFRSLLVNKKDSTGRTMNYTQPFTGNDVFDRLLTQMVSRGKLVDSKGQSITTRTGSLTMQESSSDAFSQMAQDFKYSDENGDGFSDAHWIRDSVPSNIYPGGNVTELTPEEKDEYGTTWTNVWNSGANYLVDNETYKGLSYENQADVIYELQGFARECIEADYCLDHNIEMTEAQRTAYEIRNFCTVDGKVDGKMLGLIALGTAKENKLASGGQRYVMAEQDENGKTIRNSRQLAMRHIYEEAGIYDKIVEAVQNSDGALTYADFGLGKTVVEKYSDDKADSDYQDIYGKVMKGSSGSKKKTKKVTGGSAGGITKAKGGGTLAKIKGPSAMASNPSRDTNIANNFFRAYANTFRRGSREVSSTSGGQVVCPRCGNRVYSRSGRCPICGASL